jgi:hypothetical protein
LIVGNAYGRVGVFRDRLSDQSRSQDGDRQFGKVEQISRRANTRGGAVSFL